MGGLQKSLFHSQTCVMKACDLRIHRYQSLFRTGYAHKERSKTVTPDTTPTTASEEVALITQGARGQLGAHASLNRR